MSGRAATFTTNFQLFHIDGAGTIGIEQIERFTDFSFLLLRQFRTRSCGPLFGSPTECWPFNRITGGCLENTDVGRSSLEAIPTIEIRLGFVDGVQEEEELSFQSQIQLVPCCQVHVLSGKYQKFLDRLTDVFIFDIISTTKRTHLTLYGYSVDFISRRGR